jgi:hypothetical protein|tara:strand:+ start:287 stop:517 length:231 start_codon:yes stop_codon:yes gene_type:complete
MVDISAATPVIGPWVTLVEQLVGTVKILVGGFFGLYVVMFVHRIISHKKLSKRFEKLFHEIEWIKKELKLKKKSKS